MFSGLIEGFHSALTLENLFYCFSGAFLGTLIGVLPGVGPLVTIAMLLPFTYYLDPAAALIMLAGIYYGSSYGGSTTSILLNIPGETSSVVTCIDGHAMAKQGRAGPALAIAAIGSVIAGVVGTALLGGLAPSLSRLALQFGPIDYFSLMVLGLIGAVVLADGSLLKSLICVILGMLAGLVGTDVNSGAQRFTFGRLELADGIEFVALAMGLFGLAEILRVLIAQQQGDSSVLRYGKLFLTREDMRRSKGPILRGSAIGSLFGLLPGGGGALSTYASYMLEKRISKHPHEFGNGAIEGVAGPEAANNAASQSSFIPLLTLGLPSNGTMALMAGALMIHGITPGPQFIVREAGLFWTVIASMFIGNAMLLILNLPLVGLWVQLLRIPYRLLYPIIILFCCLGIYNVSGSSFDLYAAAFFAVLGFILIAQGFEPAPLLLGFIMGPIMEENLRRGLIMSRGDFSVLLTQPVSAGLLLLSALLLAGTLFPHVARFRGKAFTE